MTDDKPAIELSRRKLLGGLGAIGVGSAGAALGTSAYFSDEESFDGNSLTAGELDLLLDYQVTYHGGPGRLEDIQDMGYEDAEPIEDEEGTYLLERVPDTGDIANWDEYVLENGFCGEESRDMLVNGDEVAPIHLQDVKPGDSGCLTTSLHLCDNPAYIWMNGALTANDDNGLTEPEGEVDDTGGEGEGELAQNIETTVWYDENCDCAVDQGGEEGGEADVLLVLDVSGSMSSDMGSMRDAANGLVDELGSDANVGLVSYSTEPSDPPVQELTDDHGAVESAINGLGSGGQTNIEGGVEVAQDELLNGTNARSGADKYMVVMSDGNANEDYDGDGSDDPTDEATDAKDEGIELYTVSFGGDSGTLQDMASDPWEAHFFEAEDDDELIDAFADIGQNIAGERVIFEGTLEELTGVLSTNDGIPLDGDRETGYDEVVEGEPAAGDGEGREPFKPSETHCIGLDWELPVEVGNEVQTDSVAFDVGFYAEQSRHNDGSGSQPA